jgi:hypothetical protein
LTRRLPQVKAPQRSSRHGPPPRDDQKGKLRTFEYVSLKAHETMKTDGLMGVQ